ncbi:hypothetical protein SLE2022_376290 [Rubroshorea leprosula]
MGGFLSIQCGALDPKPSFELKFSLLVNQTTLVVGIKDFCCLEMPPCSQQAILFKGVSSHATRDLNESTVSKRSMSMPRAHVYKNQHRTKGGCHPYSTSKANHLPSYSPHLLHPLQRFDKKDAYPLQMVSNDGNKGTFGVSNLLASSLLPISNDDHQIGGEIVSNNQPSPSQETPQVI